ncbi:MAG: phosphopantetheine-binding protein [Polaromonas sp.]|uniref:phosphopantetheine-binding protein n=1 Tax=Polaromonas sp. TaxID=1869339 RepID=UPI00271F56ED|nr:phosphopantetheine-binding protein [Polaromonas sp.]MDO9113683.1 phosphopantetheine-binding protein [Polaromonas sp.]
MTEITSPMRANDQALQLEVAQLIVEALNLDIKASEIAPDAPLYGDGLGLDSIDILEISLVISKQYGLQLRADDQDNQSFFSSLSSLTAYIGSQRTR